MRKAEFTFQVPILAVGMPMPILCASHAPVLLLGAVSSGMVSLSTDVTFLGYTGHGGRSWGQWSSLQGGRSRTRSALLVATNKAG